MRRISAWLAGLMLAATCAVLFPAPAAAPSPPALSVELRPAEQSFNASYETQEVTFFGRITLSNAPYSKYEVFLDACSDPGWSASCTPDYVTFWGEGAADFKISVIVPHLATDRTARIWVESRATYEDVDVAGNVSGNVYITVGKLPENGGIGGNGGERFFGDVSGRSDPAPVILAGTAVFLAVGLILGFAFWRWRRNKAGKDRTNE